MSADAVFDARAATAIADDLALLSRLHDREVDAPFLDALRAVGPQDWFALRMGGPVHQEGVRLLSEAMAAWSTPPSGATLDDLAAEYAAIYLTHAYRASPYESVWRDEDNLERQGPMFEVREVYKRHGVRAPDWRRRGDDHIALELDFLAQAMRAIGTSGTAWDAADFLRSHPMRWVPDFVQRVVARCREPFYAGVALLTLAYLDTLREFFAQALGFDMTVPVEEGSAGRADGPPRPTCADPPANFPNDLS